MKVIGIQKNVSFDYEGRTYKGLNLYVTDVKSGVDGVVSYKFFMNQDKPIYADALEVKLGDNITFNYNRFGKPEALFLDND